MSSPTLSPSKGPRRFVAPLLSVGLAAAFVLPLPIGAISTSGTVIVQEGRVIEEDLFAGAARVVIDGTIQGDLTVATRSLVINGVVEGDVNGVAWSVDIAGEVGGSVRAVAWEMDVTGSVGDDILTLARSLEVDGTVGRDVLVAALSARNSGQVGGEIRGELVWSLYLDGSVAEDVDVGVHRLTITDTAAVGSAVNWRQGLIGQNIRGWTTRTEISNSADLGLVSEVRPIATDITVRALRLLLQLLRFVGLLFTGMLLLYLFPRLTERAVDRAWSRPVASFLVGVGVFVLVPILAVLTLFTIVMAPVALLAVGLWLFGLFAGAIPALTALGRRVTGKGLLGSFMVAAVAWRILRMIPLVGFFIFLLAVIWGMGAWTLSLWDGWNNSRAAEADDGDLSPRLGSPMMLANPGPRLELLGLDLPPED